MPTSTMTSKGQTTIPKEIRDRLHLRPGDRLEFIEEESGRVVILPATTPISALAGSLKHRARKRPATLDEMDRAIAEAAAEGLKR